MVLRVAHLTDSFNEINGVAHTSRNFVAYAKRNHLPFLCVCGTEPGNKRDDIVFSQCDTVQILELKRSKYSKRLEYDLHFDPLFFRYSTLIEKRLRDFKPDLIHITGMSELGFLGVYFAWKLEVPLTASWHTNLHQYASHRAERFWRFLGGVGVIIGQGIEAAAFEIVEGYFYRQAKVLFAPYSKLCTLLEQKTGRICHLMQRGVDTTVFTPSRRTRAENDGRIVLGFVGRLSVEKNVGLLPEIDKELRMRMKGVDIEWLIVGHGSEEKMLRRKLPVSTHFTGILRHEVLAMAYANMDLLVFPSHTDTFGNVVLEALASGVPAIVTPDHGPATLVQNGITGRVVEDAGFASAIVDVLGNRQQHLSMRQAARVDAFSYHWDETFDNFYARCEEHTSLYSGHSNRGHSWHVIVSAIIFAFCLTLWHCLDVVDGYISSWWLAEYACS